MFKQRTVFFVNLLHRCPYPPTDIVVIYQQCCLPTASYPLLATSMLIHQLYKLQSPATALFLSKLGILEHFLMSSCMLTQIREA